MANPKTNAGEGKTVNNNKTKQYMKMFDDTFTDYSLDLIPKKNMPQLDCLAKKDSIWNTIKKKLF